MAGIAGPVLFTAGFLVLGFVRRGGYDPVAQQVSDLTGGRYGWAQQANFVVFGLLLIAFAAAVHLGVRAVQTGLWEPAILALNGAELVVAGLFPLSEDAAGTAYDPIGVHSMNGRIFFLGIGIALVVDVRAAAGRSRVPRPGQLHARHRHRAVHPVRHGRCLRRAPGGAAPLGLAPRLDEQQAPSSRWPRMSRSRRR